MRGAGPSGRAWLVRMYIIWTGRDSTQACLGYLEQLAGAPSELDIQLCYRDRDGDVEAWVELLAETVTRWGDRFASLGVTAEANLVGLPGAADGDFPRLAALYRELG